jgi:hypothetical protein
MREHGHSGIDLPVSGEQELRRAARPARRGTTGPRPARPSALPVSARPDVGSAVRHSVAYFEGAERGADSRAIGRVRAGEGDGASAARGPARGGVVALGGVGALGDALGVGCGAGAGRWADVGFGDGACVMSGAPGAGRWPDMRLADGAGGGAGVRDEARARVGVANGARVGAAGALDGTAVEAASAGVRRGHGSGGDQAGRARASTAGPRLLICRPQAPGPSVRIRRIMAGLALALAAAAVVVGLGRIADVAADARAAEAPAARAEVTVTIAAPGTVWDVADGVAPGVSGPQRAALVDRIVEANALTSVRVSPGEVLRVPL